jgi:hypothetical protein
MPRSELVNRVTRAVGNPNDELIAALESVIDALEKERTNNIVKVLMGSKVTDGACYKVCVGDTGKGETKWEMPNGRKGKILTRIDISACGFTSPPIVTTALGGDGHHDKSIGVSYPFELTKSRFVINLLGETVTGFEQHANPIDLTKANSYRWHVMWIAVGSVC